MAEEKAALGEINYRKLFPWTELFRSFRVALDPKKLLLAAAGILVMSLGWWVLGWAFFDPQEKRPEWEAYRDSGAYAEDPSNVRLTKKWRDFKDARRQWYTLYTAAGTTPVAFDAYDFASAESDVERAKKALETAIKEEKTTVKLGDVEESILPRPFGLLRTLPFFEDRGPNPYLLVSGQTPPARELGPLGEWFSRQAYVLVEPLFKIFYPLVYLLAPRTGLLNRFYFLLVTLVTLATWALFGGAITRMAVVQVARNDKVGMVEALRFVAARYLSYFSAPLFPLIFIAFLVGLVALGGLLYLIPIFGEIIVVGLGYPLILCAGIAMAVVLVGLIGWPMMNATISTEGSDSFDALSRSYSYVYQSPWSYLGYSLVSIAYGAVVVFFIGFMGSLVVYLGKWSLSQTPFVETANREPSFLFIYAPTSFGWRTLLLEGATTADGESVVKDGKIDKGVYQKFVTGVPAVPAGETKPEDAKIREGTGLNWWNYAGACMVAGWLYLFFLMVLGFGYSYFWSASTLIYLLMRRKVDDTDMDEVYLAEDETEEPYSAPSTVSGTTAPPATSTPLTMVDPPALRPSAPPTAPEPAHSGPASDATGKTDGDGEAKL